MQDLDEFTVTDAALEQMAKTPDPRMKEIMDAAVRHLHAFARDVRLTPGGVADRHPVPDRGGPGVHAVPPGVHPAGRRAGVSALVNAMHDKQARELGTQSSLLGPFYREGAPELPLGASIVANPSEP